MTETFGMRLVKARRGHMMPMQDKPRQVPHMTQEELAALLLISLSAVRHYERSRRLPHPIIRRELVRIFPNLFDSM